MAPTLDCAYASTDYDNNEIDVTENVTVSSTAPNGENDKNGKIGKNDKMGKMTKIPPRYIVVILDMANISS